ncbi:MAG: hypothetical protein J6U64_01320, partial [Alphaproteobacteria bacterium]|nr:hypothetical protein [Alphaproteobacteria bacterium]
RMVQVIRINVQIDVRLSLQRTVLADMIAVHLRLNGVTYMKKLNVRRRRSRTMTLKFVVRQEERRVITVTRPKQTATAGKMKVSRPVLAVVKVKLS